MEPDTHGNGTPSKSSSDSEKEGRKSVAELLRNFAENTSMHGLGRVASSRFLWLRLFWALLVMAGACVAGYNMVKIILRYFEYPVSTVVSVEYEPNIFFPAVTICNLNLLKKSELEKNTILHQFRSEYEDPSSFNDTGNGYYYYDEDYEFEIFDAEKTFDEDENLRTFLATQDREVRKQFGHQITNMLLSCSFSRTNCSTGTVTGEECYEVTAYTCSGYNEIRDFTAFLNHKFGNCYTFNKDGQSAFASKAGPTYGLKLLLNAEESEYIHISDSVGFKVVIHPHDEMPFPEDEGIMISPGFTTTIAIRRKDILRTSAPYGRCHVYGEEYPGLNMYADVYNVSYTDKACYRTCFQNTMYSQCQCCHRDYPCYIEDKKGDLLHVPFCNNSFLDVVECSDYVRMMHEDDLLGCEDLCLPSCWETEFVSEVSTGRYPSPPRAKKTVAYLQKHLAENANGTTTPNSTNITSTYLRNNVAHVSIFFKQLNFEKLKTEPAYDWSRLVSDLGGQFGLWLGFSLLTAVEIIQLLAEIFHQLGRRLVFFKGSRLQTARVGSEELNLAAAK